ELSTAKAIQADCDVKEKNIILQALPTEIYTLFDIDPDLKEIEFLLHQDIDSSLKDSIDIANHTNNVVDSVPEMFTDEHALDYSSRPIFDEYDDDFLEIKSDAENVYDDPFDSKGEKIKESKLLINELDLPCDFLPSEYDSFISQDFSRVDALPSTNNEDKIFNPGTKWVFRNKLDENGIVSRNKARLVAKGYNQQESIDYDETYAPVASQNLCDAFAKIMHDEFEMSTMGELNFFLGLQIKKMKDEIFFNQSKYIKEMLNKSGLEDSKPTKTPMSMEIKLTKDDEADSLDSSKYRENPLNTHFEAVKRIFRYIRGTSHLGLWYPKGTGIETVVYTDSDHAGDYVDRKSTSGIFSAAGIQGYYCLQQKLMLQVQELQQLIKLL
nr:hypothetical protein [Tanacetum cinerariifolium]